MLDSQSLSVQDVALVVTGGQDILFIWETISIDMSDEPALHLMQEIAEEWIQLRAHSIGKSYMEGYKTRTKAALKAKKSLRKELKKSDEEEKSDEKEVQECDENDVPEPW